jgi:folylpolyglutamate synthase/dihydropteroate synthase
MSDGANPLEVAEMPKTNLNDERIWKLLAPLSRWGNGPDLDRTTRLMGAQLGELPKGLVITGSNGKGTVTYLTSALLQRDGLRVGRYVSPHLWSITERISINNTAVSADVFADALECVIQENDERDIQAASRFEVLTGAAVRLFSAQNVDTIVWEAGLGGRLDPTRLVPKYAAALTNVSLEHTAILGSTALEIALEKAEIARMVDSDDYVPLVIGALAQDLVDTLESRQPIVSPPKIPVKLSLGGPHQKSNAQIATCLAEIVSQRQRRQVDFSDVNVPCRTECIRPGKYGQPALWVDVAHHESSIVALLPWLQQLPRPLSIIFGVSNDRDSKPMLNALPAHANVILSEAPYKATPVGQIDTELMVNRCPNLDDAIRLANRTSAPVGSIVVLGGLYLAAAAAAIIRGHKIQRLRWN